MKKFYSITLSIMFLIPFLNAEEKGAAMNKIVKSDAEWKKILTPEEYRVTRQGATECAFTGRFWNFKGGRGVFKCVCCGNELFSTDAKFESGTGWPSFTEVFKPDSVVKLTDTSHGMIRTEIRCARCDAHLGHVFSDGPAPGKMRYCINSAALKFQPYSEKAAFAAGCFWGVEEDFRKLDGVISTAVGYMGGTSKAPSYKDVCTGQTGHAETLYIEFDPSKTSYAKLLEEFWRMHDPTTLNRQGPDIGTQYRSVIFYYSEEQKKSAGESMKAAQKLFKRPIVTVIVPASEFYRAEEYHQRYIEKKGGSSCHL